MTYILYRPSLSKFFSSFLFSFYSLRIFWIYCNGIESVMVASMLTCRVPTLTYVYVIKVDQRLGIRIYSRTFRLTWSFFCMVVAWYLSCVVSSKSSVFIHYFEHLWCIYCLFSPMADAGWRDGMFMFLLSPRSSVIKIMYNIVYKYLPKPFAICVGVLVMAEAAATATC